MNEIAKFLQENPSMIEDLLIASKLLARKRPIVTWSLKRYAEALQNYQN